MKRFIKNNVFGFIIGAILFSVVGVGATLLYNSDEVKYNATDSTWDVSNVKQALDQLRDDTKYGTATADDIANGKTALVQGEKITGTSASASGMTITDLSFTAIVNGNQSGDGATSSSVSNTMIFDVSNYSKVTFGTITKKKTNTYNNSELTYTLDAGTAVSAVSDSVIDVSSASTFKIAATPTIYGNAFQTRSGSVTITSLTFE